jgi:hypothetical protein
MCFVNDVYDAFHAFHAFYAYGFAFHVYACVDYRHEQHYAFPQEMASPLSDPLTIS